MFSCPFLEKLQLLLLIAHYSVFLVVVPLFWSSNFLKGPVGILTKYNFAINFPHRISAAEKLFPI